MTQTLNVFVYGTLKPQEANYAAYCEGKVITTIKAYTWGEIYHLRQLGYPALIKGENKVQGYLLTLADLSYLFDLDQLEGYQEKRKPDENEYNRELVEVYEVSSHKYLGKAWAYFMDLSKIQSYGGEWIASGDWNRNL